MTTDLDSPSAKARPTDYGDAAAVSAESTASSPLSSSRHLKSVCAAQSLCGICGAVAVVGAAAAASPAPTLAASAPPLTLKNDVCTPASAPSSPSSMSALLSNDANRSARAVGVSESATARAVALKAAAAALLRVGVRNAAPLASLASTSAPCAPCCGGDADAAGVAPRRPAPSAGVLGRETACVLMRGERTVTARASDATVGELKCVREARADGRCRRADTDDVDGERVGAGRRTCAAAAGGGSRAAAGAPPLPRARAGADADDDGPDDRDDNAHGLDTNKEVGTAAGGGAGARRGLGVAADGDGCDGARAAAAP